jgi:hypothetical protein
MINRRPIPYPTARAPRLAVLHEFLADAAHILSTLQKAIPKIGAPPSLEASWRLRIRACYRRVRYCEQSLRERLLGRPEAELCQLDFPQSDDATAWAACAVTTANCACGALVLAWPLPEDYDQDLLRYREAVFSHGLCISRIVDVVDDIEAWISLRTGQASRLIH